MMHSLISPLRGQLPPREAFLQHILHGISQKNIPKRPKSPRPREEALPVLGTYETGNPGGVMLSAAKHLAAAS